MCLFETAMPYKKKQCYNKANSVKVELDKTFSKSKNEKMRIEKWTKEPVEMGKKRGRVTSQEEHR